MLKITDFKLFNKDCKVYITSHGFIRLKERFSCKNNNTVTPETIANNISLLGTKIIKYSMQNDEIAIIDKQNNFTIITAFKYVDEHYKVYIISVINKSKLKLLENTKYEVLNLA